MSMTQKKMFSAEISQLKNDGGDAPEGSVGEGINQQQYQELLDAIHSVRDGMNDTEQSAAASIAVNEAAMEDFKKEFAESIQLKSELEELSRVILDTRREISSLNATDSGPKIHAMTDQLDAVVGDTEGATNAILEAVEAIEDKNESLQLNATDPDELEITEGISNAVMKIYEACNFQDITGQRISKVVGTLKFVEDRIMAMIDILGDDSEFNEASAIVQPAQMDGDVELSGPTVEGHEISQDEIDALFD